MRVSVPAVIGVLLAVGASSARAEPPRPDRLLDAAVAADGTLVVVRAKGERALTVEADGKALPILDLDAMPKGATVVGVRAAANATGVVLGFALDEGSQRTYRFASLRDGAWRISLPLFVDAGAPWTPLHVRLSEAGGLEITFRRGTLPPIGRQGDAIEEVVYADAAAAAPAAGDLFKPHLWSLGLKPQVLEAPATESGPSASLDIVDGGLVLQGAILGRLVGVPADEEERTATALRAHLTRLVAAPMPREPNGASRLGLLVRAERTAKWKIVQRIMQICAEPEIKIYRLTFQVISLPLAQRVIWLSVEGRGQTAPGVLRVGGLDGEPVSCRLDAAHRTQDLDALGHKFAALRAATARASLRLEYLDVGGSRVEPRDVADVGARLIAAGFEDVRIASQTAVGRDAEGR